MKKINTLLEELYSLTQGTMTKDTSRIEELSAFLDEPHKNYPTIHIAGTNGKGSICSMLASIFQENGYKVGLYTSPHVLRFNERIKINGKCILDEEIIEIYELMRGIAHKNGASFFEITTAIAFKYFSDKKVDIAIIETGLGGRLDSTNIITPILSIITSISEEHTQILGKTLTKIVKEKSGIIKEGVPVIVQDTDPRIISVLLKEAEKKSAPMYIGYDFPNMEFVGYKNNEMVYDIHRIAGMADFLDDKDFFFNIDVQNISIEQRFSSLLGSHQISNIKLTRFVVLFLSCNFLIKKGTTNSGIQNVVANTGFHFRIENIAKNSNDANIVTNYSNPIILDVAHNPRSIQLLVDTLSLMQPDNKWNFIFAAMKDKNITQMLQYILPICNKLTLVELDMERAAKPSVIEKKALELGFNNVVIEKDTIKACKDAESLNEPTVICGSFYIMKDAVEAYQLEDMFL